MKFHQMYLAALYEALAQGGHQTTIDKLVAEINEPTQAGLTAYLQTVPPPRLNCGNCGAHFPPPPNPHLLDDEVLCATCQSPPPP